MTLRRVGDVGLVGLIYHVPAGSHAEFPAVRVLAEVLDSEPSGRLYKALVETKKASSVSASAQAYHDPGALEIMAEVNTKDRAALEQVRDTMLSVLEDVARSGVTQEEVDRARQSLLKNYELAAHDPNRIAILLSEWAAQGDWRLYFLNRDRLEKVTPAQVKEVAEKYLTASNRTVGFFLPTAKPERTPVPEVPDIAKLSKATRDGRPESAASETFDVAPMAIEARVQRPEPIARHQAGLPPQEDARRIRPTAADAPLWKRREPQRIQRGRRLPPGADDPGHQVDDPPADQGRARQELRSARRRYGRADDERDGRAQCGRGHLRRRDPASQPPGRPGDPPPDPPRADPAGQRVRGDEERGDRRHRGEPIRSRCARAFNHFQRLSVAIIPATTSATCRRIDEQIERTTKVSIDQVRALYHEYLGADHGELVIIGDFEPSEVLPILGKTFEGWKAEKPYAPDRTTSSRTSAGERNHRQTPDKANAIYLAGLQLPLKDSDPDYPALLTGNYVLGGGALSSRIADRLRQKDGLSYAATSVFAADPLDPHADIDDPGDL